MFSGIHSFEDRPKHRLSECPTQKEYEIRALAGIYSRIAPKRRVVEIGTQRGYSLRFWLELAQPGATIVAIDWWNKKEMAEDPRPTWESWVPEGVNFHSIIGDSHHDKTREVLLRLVYEIDFLFIDGDHTYEGVTQDWHMYGPLVRPGGVIAFHDLITPDFSPHIGVGKLWREIQRAGYKTIELYAQPESEQKWGGIGVVFV